MSASDQALIDAVRAGQVRIIREQAAQSERIRRIEARQDEYWSRVCSFLQDALSDGLIDDPDFVERVLARPSLDLSEIETARVNQIMRRAQVRRQSN